MQTGMWRIGHCDFGESCRCLESWSLSDYPVKPWRLHIIVVETEVNVILELRSLVMWNPIDVNKLHVEKLEHEIGESCNGVKIWSLNTMLNPAYYKLL